MINTAIAKKKYGTNRKNWNKNDLRACVCVRVWRRYVREFRKQLEPTGTARYGGVAAAVDVDERPGRRRSAGGRGSGADQLRPPDSETARLGPVVPTAVDDSQHDRPTDQRPPLEPALHRREILVHALVP